MRLLLFVSVYVVRRMLRWRFVLSWRSSFWIFGQCMNEKKKRRNNKNDMFLKKHIYCYATWLWTVYCPDTYERPEYRSIIIDSCQHTTKTYNRQIGKCKFPFLISAARFSRMPVPRVTCVCVCVGLPALSTYYLSMDFRWLIAIDKPCAMAIAVELIAIAVY